MNQRWCWCKIQGGRSDLHGGETGKNRKGINFVLFCFHVSSFLTTLSLKSKIVSQRSKRWIIAIWWGAIQIIGSQISKIKPEPRRLVKIKTKTWRVITATKRGDLISIQEESSLPRDCYPAFYKGKRLFIRRKKEKKKKGKKETHMFWSDTMAVHSDGRFPWSWLLESSLRNNRENQGEKYKGKEIKK